MTHTVVAALFVLALPAAAQTDDALWRLWSSREGTLAPRSLALGGADIALSDDASAAPANPALSATLWRHEAAASFTGARLAHVGVARWSANGLTGAVHLRRPTRVSERAPFGRLDIALTEVGAQVARRYGPHLALGIGVTATRLVLSGESAVVVDGARLRTGVGADSLRMGGSLGAVWETPVWTAAAALHSGATFAGMRTATRNGAWDDAGSPVEVRRPWRASVGASVRPTLRLSLHAQADLRGAGLLRRAARELVSRPPLAPEGAGWAAWRAGVQYALPLERVSVVLRAGVARLSAAGLRAETVDSSGARTLVSATPARTRVTAGVGLAFEKTTLDVANDGAGRWSVEIRLRRL